MAHPKDEQRWVQLAISLDDRIDRGLLDFPEGFHCELQGADTLAQSYRLENWRSGLLSGAIYAFRKNKLNRQRVIVWELKGRLQGDDIEVLAFAAAAAVARLGGATLEGPPTGWQLADAEAEVLGSPFHYRGSIRPRYEAAWSAMKRYDSLLDTIFRYDLRRDLPEFLAILAPELTGKTTFARQLIERAPADIFIAYTQLGGIGKQETEASITQRICAALDEQFARLLTPDRVFDSFIQEVTRVMLRGAPKSCHEFRYFLNDLIFSLKDAHRRYVLVFDDADLLPAKLRVAFFECLRSLHESRGTGPLSHLSVVILARSLREGRRVSPLDNVVKKYELEDFSWKDLQAFLERCQPHLNGVKFTPEAMQYLFRQTGGHAVLIQRICEMATRKKQTGETVQLVDILRGIANCFEDANNVPARMLDMTAFKPQTLEKLCDIACNNRELPFGVLKSIAELEEAGLVKQTPEKTCIMRSPLLQSLFLTRFARPQNLPPLNEVQQRLVKLPPILTILLDESYFGRLKDAIYSNSSSCYDQVFSFLERGRNEFDWVAIRFFYNRYFNNRFGDELDEDGVVLFLAKVFSRWCEDEVNGEGQPTML